MKGQNNIIPSQDSGVQTNTESTQELATLKEAKEFYVTVCERLMDINNWQQIAGKATASFQLTDNSGNDVQREAQKGDHLKIDIPGPGTVSGEGFDWVQIEAIEKDQDEKAQWTAIRVRPATSPLNERKDVAHFFSDDTTSTFMVRQEGNKVIAGVYGRNEKPNTNTETNIDKIRNAAIATGAITGFSKIQWKSLVNGLVKK
ncbi:MAG TPA: hypothetical protein VJ499_03840 [Flavisolibacter sp.]|nr:hypothetical protein [Flavisolibacter sp.]